MTASCLADGLAATLMVAMGRTVITQDTAERGAEAVIRFLARDMDHVCTLVDIAGKHRTAQPRPIPQNITEATPHLSHP